MSSKLAWFIQRVSGQLERQIDPDKKRKREMVGRGEREREGREYGICLCPGSFIPE